MPPLPQFAKEFLSKSRQLFQGKPLPSNWTNKVSELKIYLEAEVAVFMAVVLAIIVQAAAEVLAT